MRSTAPLVVCVGILLGCADQQDPASMREPAGPQFDYLIDGEGELMGDVYFVGGENFYVELEPFTPAQGSWRNGAHSWTMWVDPNRHNGRNYMFEWGDPADGGICSELYQYNASPRIGKTEVHYESPGVIGTGMEKHCIRPGTYWIRLRDGSPSGPPIEEFIIDYEGVIGAVWDSTKGVRQFVQDRSASAGVFDLIVHFDLNKNQYATTTVALDLENAGANRLKNWFRNQGSPAGNETDFFRASVARTVSSWNRHDKGAFLARLYWDTARAGRKLDTNYYSTRHNDEWLLRTMQYGDSIEASRTVYVGAEFKRPDRNPNSPIDIARAIQFTRTAPPAPVADITFESGATWMNTDQYITVGASNRGSNYRYSWSIDNGYSWSPENTDTLLDFWGHSTQGVHTVSLRVRNTSTNQTSQANRSFNVSSGSASLSGPAYIMVKKGYTYTSNMMGDWFERWIMNSNPLDWYRLSAAGYPSDSLNVVWPAGCYEIELRHENDSSHVLKRAKLTIGVATVPSCYSLAASPEVAGQMNTIPQSESASSSLFGGGPLLVQGSPASPRITQLYDLMGSYNVPPFTSVDWLQQAGGHHFLPDGTSLIWSRIHTDPNGPIIFRFSVSASTDEPYSFGFAADPDLGSNPANDRSGYDASRKMVYAFDDEAAWGMIIEDRSGTLRRYGNMARNGLRLENLL